MIIIVSPAKKLNHTDKAPIDKFSHLSHLDKSARLIKVLREYSHLEIAKLMKLSDDLTHLNRARYKSFKLPFDLNNAKQAIYTFKGATYVGLDIDSFSKSQVNYAQKHLRILSGLYGLIAPLDLIQPYRLEMGTRMSCGEAKNLYQFWRKTITDDLNVLLKKEKFLVNLASKEYFSVIDLKLITGKVITPIFKQKKGADYKVIGFTAKKARGMMSQYLLKNKITDPVDIKSFNAEGYTFSEAFSNEAESVFIRG